MEPTPTPSPSATLDPTLIAQAELTIAAIVIGIAVGVAALVVFSALMVRAARYPMPTPLIAPLSMLALVSMILGAVLEQAQELITVAAAAVGALAAVLTTVFKAGEIEENAARHSDENYKRGLAIIEGMKSEIDELRSKDGTSQADLVEQQEHAEGPQGGLGSVQAEAERGSDREVTDGEQG